MPAGDTTEFGALCRVKQYDWDQTIDAYKNWRNKSGDPIKGALIENKLKNIRKSWQELGCQESYGSIIKLTQWTGEPSEWALSAFDASHTVVGDFTGDGRADVSVFTEGSDYWSSSLHRYDLYTATRKIVPGPGGNGDFVGQKMTNPELQEFRQWATNPGAKVFAGDFNGDKRADYLEIDPDHGTMSVAFALGGNTFQSPITQTNAFADLAGEATSKVVVGDFNGDGKDDLAAVGNTGWTGVKVASSSGSGAFSVTTSGPVNQFMDWASDPAAKVVAGDFNGDHKDDLLLYGKKCWTQGPDSCAKVIPIASATATGFDAEQHPFVSGYDKAAASSAANETADIVVGDYNADGNDDLVIFSSLKHPTQIDTFINDVYFIRLNGATEFGSQMVAGTRDQLLPKILFPGAVPLAGDFDRDGKDDIVVAGRFDNSTMPVMFYKGADQVPVFTDNLVASPTCAPPACGGVAQ